MSDSFSIPVTFTPNCFTLMHKNKIILGGWRKIKGYFLSSLKETFSLDIGYKWISSLCCSRSLNIVFFSTSDHKLFRFQTNQLILTEIIREKNEKIQSIFVRFLDADLIVLSETGNIEIYNIAKLTLSNCVNIKANFKIIHPYRNFARLIFCDDLNNIYRFSFEGVIQKQAKQLITIPEKVFSLSTNIDGGQVIIGGSNSIFIYETLSRKLLPIYQIGTMPISFVHIDNFSNSIYFNSKQNEILKLDIQQRSIHKLDFCSKSSKILGIFPIEIDHYEFLAIVFPDEVKFLRITNQDFYRPLENFILECRNLENKIQSDSTCEIREITLNMNSEIKEFEQIENSQKKEIELKQSALKQLATETKKISDYYAERVSESRYCIICYSSPRKIVFKNCYHFAVCEQCANNIRNPICPICKQLIDGKLLVEYVTQNIDFSDIYKGTGM